MTKTTYRRLHSVDQAARFRHRTLVAVGMRKQRLKRVFKAEPDVRIHETVRK